MYNYNQRLAEMQKLGLVRILVDDVIEEVLNREVKSSGLFDTYPCRVEARFQLVLQVEKASDTAVFFVQGDNKNINFLSDKSPVEEKTAIFYKNIGTSPNKEGHHTTKNNAHQTNGVWFVSFAKGKLMMWEVAIVTNIVGDDSKYYLSLQLVYTADMYKKKDELWIPPDQFPGYENWYSLQDFLQDAVDIKSLKSASRYKVAKIEPMKLADKQAKIDWFSQSRRYGLGRLGDSRMCRLHASQVLEQEFPAFEPGQIVLFDSLRTTPQGADLIGVKEI